MPQGNVDRGVVVGARCDGKVCGQGGVGVGVQVCGDVGEGKVEAVPVARLLGGSRCSLSGTVGRCRDLSWLLIRS